MPIDPDVQVFIDQIHANANDLAMSQTELRDRVDVQAGQLSDLMSRVDALEGTQGQPPAMDDQSFTLAENTAPGASVGLVAAERGATFRIVGGNDQGVYEIQPTTGELTLVGEVDYETVPLYMLRVEVANAFGTVEGSVNVEILDVDEGGDPIPPDPPVEGEFHVGPGQVYASFAALPDPIPDNTIVWVHPKSTPYHEKFLIRGHHVTISGVVGPNGERPIIDGANAVSANSGIPNPQRGLVTISKATSDPWGYRPDVVVIEGLHIRNAHPDHTFDGGTSYWSNAAGIYLERGGNITIRDCEISHCGNGVFGASGDELATLVNDVVLEDCYLHSNGVVGQDRYHSSYIESLRMTYRTCTYGPVLPGSQAEMLKDRSTHTQVLDCTFTGYGSRMLGLVEPEDGWEQLSVDDGWDTVVVTGCTIETDGGNPIHFGSDNQVGVDGNRDKHLLLITNLTLNHHSNRSSRWSTELVRCPDYWGRGDVSRIECRNVQIHRELLPGATQHGHFTLLNSSGVIEFYPEPDATLIEASGPMWTDYRNNSSLPGSQILGREHIGVVSGP